MGFAHASAIAVGVRGPPSSRLRQCAAVVLRGRVGARTELSLAVMASKLKRLAKLLGMAPLTQFLHQS
jgi:hypothetical protein